MQKLTKTGELTRFEQQFTSASEYLALENKTGIQAIQLQPEDDVDALSDHLKDITVIGVDFPAFADGRGFSHARKLRDVLAYEGEIIAVGNFMQDQLYYLKRCGFDSFAVADDAPIDSMRESLNDFSDAYQAAADEPRPLFRRR